MLNPGLDFAPYAHALAKNGRVVIPNFLSAEHAQALYENASNLPFTLFTKGPSGEESVPCSQTEASQEAMDRMRAGLLLAQQESPHLSPPFAFAYEGYHVIKAILEGASDSTAAERAVQDFAHFVNSLPFLDFARRLTGDRLLARIDMQATRYRAGHFLLRHNDYIEAEQRRFAYVLNLSKNWHPDCGGLLQFLDLANDAVAAQAARVQPRVVETYTPAFNQLCLFRVPQWHGVSPVASFASGDRLALTGWFRW